MSMLLYTLLVTVLVLPLGVKPQSASGSGIPIVPLASLSDLSQQQRDNLVTVGFSGMTAEEFLQPAVVETFQEATANAINTYFNNRVAKRQVLVSPADVTVVNAMTMDGILLVVFVVGGQGGQNAPINSLEMVDILQIEGAQIAQALEAALGIPVEFVGVMGVQPPTPEAPVQFSLTAIIGVVAGGVLAVLLLTVLIVAVVVYSCCRRKSRAKAESTSATYVEVPAEDENSFSSKWQPMKVSASGDYVAVPTVFNRENPDANTNSAL